MGYMGGCQNYGPCLGPYYNMAPSTLGTQKGAIILMTTHIPYVVVTTQEPTGPQGMAFSTSQPSGVGGEVVGSISSHPKFVAARFMRASRRCSWDLYCHCKTPTLGPEVYK